MPKAFKNYESMDVIAIGLYSEGKVLLAMPLDNGVLSPVPVLKNKEKIPKMINFM